MVVIFLTGEMNPPLKISAQIIKSKGGNIIGNRTRPFAYIFRATDKEKQIIDERIKQSGLSMTEFVIRAITDKPITVVENAGEILTELKRQGNNLNQAVRNYYCDSDTGEEIQSCVKVLKETYKSIIAVIEGEKECRS